MNLVNWAYFWARIHPHRVAIECDGDRREWGELASETTAAAAGLSAAGVERGGRVAIVGRNSAAWCVACLAGWRLDAIVVPINPLLSADEIAEILERSGATIVLVDEELSANLRVCRQRVPGLRVVVLDGAPQAGETAFRDLIARADVSVLDESDADENDLALLCFTSGTTGLPKGVTITQGAMIAQSMDRVLFSEFTSGNLRMISAIPLALVGGVIGFAMCVFTGGSYYTHRRFDEGEMLRLIQDEKISVLRGVPTMYERMVQHPLFNSVDLSSVFSATVGGAPTSLETLQAFIAKGVPISQVYGASEFGGALTELPKDLAAEHPASVGFPGAQSRVRIVDERDVDVPEGAVGEILARGPTITQAYWRDPELTAAAFTDGWYHTGDLGRLEDGLLYIVDRKKDMYISGGLNVYPADVERVIAGCDGVAQVAVVGLPDKHWGETGAAVVFAADHEVSAEKIVAHCREHLAHYKVPSHVFAVTEPLPSSSLGKILRREVREMVLQRLATATVADA
jgi:fatty-acyl-CoA synthase